MHLGYNVGELLSKADVVIVIDSAVPWMPRNIQPRKDAKVIHISADPLETRYPFRELEADLYVAGSSLAAMAMLRQTLADAMKGKTSAIESRRKTLAKLREEIVAKRHEVHRQRQGPDADPSGMARRLHQPGEVRGRHRDQRTRRAAAVPRTEQAAELHGQPAVRRARLRHGRRARRQARGARARGDRHGRRRLLHVRQPDPVSLRRRAPRTCRP